MSTVALSIDQVKIPFAPPFIDQDVIDEVTSALQSGWITTGPKVRALEEAVADYVEIDHVLCVNSATSGLMLALHWLGIGKGDEVIIPAYTYCATALAVMHVGATPVMVDVQNDFNIDVEKVRAAITPRTKAIIPVDFAGWPCRYNELFSVVNDAGVKEKFEARGYVQEQLGRIAIVSDAAHSFGASYYGRKTGSLADITVFSFHAVKNLTTAEGGAICITLPPPFDNAAVYKTLRLWTLNGQTKDAFSKSQAGGWRYDIVYPGFKMNMPDVCAAIGLAQARKYETEILPGRKRVYQQYVKGFSNQAWAILPPFNTTVAESSYHLFPLRIANITEQQRDTIINDLAAEGISVNVHFIPLPMLSVFKERGYLIGDYEQSYKQYATEISLPIYPQLDNIMCRRIVSAVIKSIINIFEK